jgi:hypothetical protein
MDIMLILAAFGGGIFGSLIGGTTAFIFTGFTGLVGIAVLLGTGDSTFLDTIAFGPFFGPHVAFVGGVAAAAYSGVKKASLGSSEEARLYVDGPDTVTPIFRVKDPVVLLVGGVFGIGGLLVNQLIVGTGLAVDTIAMTVVTMGIVARLAFGRQGIFGKYPAGEKKFGFGGKSITYILLYGFGLATVVSFAVVAIGVNSIGFTVSAISLIFLYTSANNFPVTHHISMVAGFAALASGNVIVGALFGAAAALLGEYVNRATNTYVKTHLDMPAIVITIGSLIALNFL